MADVEEASMLINSVRAMVMESPPIDFSVIEVEVSDEIIPRILSPFFFVAVHVSKPSAIDRLGLRISARIKAASRFRMVARSGSKCPPAPTNQLVTGRTDFLKNNRAFF